MTSIDDVSILIYINALMDNDKSIPTGTVVFVEG